MKDLVTPRMKDLIRTRISPLLVSLNHGLLEGTAIVKMCHMSFDRVIEADIVSKEGQHLSLQVVYGLEEYEAELQERIQQLEAKAKRLQELLDEVAQCAR